MALEKNPDRLANNSHVLIVMNTNCKHQHLSNGRTKADNGYNYCKARSKKQTASRKERLSSLGPDLADKSTDTCTFSRFPVWYLECFRHHSILGTTPVESSA